MSKKLREALKVAGGALNDMGWSLQIDRHSIIGERLANALETIEEALAEEPEMIQLLRWLREHYNLDNHMVIQHIREEFGYSLPKEEDDVSDSAGSAKP